MEFKWEIHVPQISRIYTDFSFYYILPADETYSVRFTQIFRHSWAPLGKRFFLPLRLSCKESSTFLTKPLFPQEREDVAGDAIALPEFWSASGACALKGWLRFFYAIKLRLFVAWRKTLWHMMLDEAINHFCNSDS